MKTIHPELAGNTYSRPPNLVRRILYPTDLTCTSHDALAVAINLARQSNAEILIVHALPPPTPIFELESPYRREAEAALAKLKKRIFTLGIKSKRVLIKGTTPMPSTIARCATFFDADLIVMGTGGRTGISRLLVGSIAAKLIRIAPCPVLVVKTTKKIGVANG
jgi:nucleotide-binding universal stress UspA family protein